MHTYPLMRYLERMGYSYKNDCYYIKRIRPQPIPLTPVLKGKSFMVPYRYVRGLSCGDGRLCSLVNPQDFATQVGLASLRLVLTIRVVPFRDNEIRGGHKYIVHLSIDIYIYVLCMWVRT